VLDRWNKFRSAGEAPFPALQQAIDAVFDARIGDISGRGKLAADMREIWMMQPRFERRSGNGPFTLVEQPRFRAGFDFLRLRADAGELSADLADWWEDFALGTPEEREGLLVAAREKPQPRRAPRAAAAAGAPAEVDEPLEGGSPAAKKRRRRRRKPAGAREGGARETAAVPPGGGDA
jgi:poly(A) polymerase